MSDRNGDVGTLTGGTGEALDDLLPGKVRWNAHDGKGGLRDMRYSTPSSQRRGPFAQDGEVATICEHAPSSSAGPLFDDTETLKVGKRGIDRRCRKIGPFDQQVGGEKGAALEGLVDPQRGAGALAFVRDAFAILLEQRDDPGRGIERLIRRLRDARKEELEPGLPCSVFAHLLEQSVIVRAVGLQI